MLFRSGQTEVVNRSLGNLLRSLVGEHVSNWDLILSQAEFAYNDFVNRSIGKMLFQVVYGYCPHKPVDIIPLPWHARSSEDAKSFAQHLKDLHEHIKNKTNVSNEMYK